MLLRAIEPVEGIETMQRLRGVTRIRDLTRGPGRLAQAMAIDFKQNGLDMCGPSPLWLGAAPGVRRRIGRRCALGFRATPIGCWRFYERGNPFVSGPKRLLV